MSPTKTNKDQIIHSLQNDLDKMRRATMDLEESEQFSQALFHASQTGILVIHSATGQIMDANQEVSEILGYEPDEILGQKIDQYGNFQVGFLDPDNQANILRNEPAIMIHKNGHEVPVIRSMTHLKSSSEDVVILSFLDNTAQKEAEKKLHQSHQQLKVALGELRMHKDKIVQSEKLASIGQLAAGVAHEINNPVGYVTSNLGTISEYAETMSAILQQYDEMEKLPEEDGPARQALLNQISQTKEEEDLEFILGDMENVMNESMEGVHRVAEIVQNLKSFAREDSSKRNLHDVNEGIGAMLKVTRNELKYRCEVERDLQEVPKVFGHGGQINQVIMNIMVNAAHAMAEKGGLLKVSTTFDGENIRVSIKDNGCGMDDETLKKIFDPFFTTKDVGMGTGLGLSISHGIIEEHGGSIEVETEVGKGTTFHIILPPAEEDQIDPSTEPAIHLDDEIIG